MPYCSDSKLYNTYLNTQIRNLIVVYIVKKWIYYRSPETYPIHFHDTFIQNTSNKEHLFDVHCYDDLYFFQP